MNLRDPLAHARGLGTAKEGTGHFIAQRLTAVALAPLSLWFLLAALHHFGSDYAEARSFLAQPLNGALMAAFALALFYHAQLGLQVVIEDYVHTRWLELSAQIAVKFACFFAALLSLLAIVRISLGG